MSNQDINLTLEKREVVRKGLNKLKTDGSIPAVIHDPGKESIIVSGNYLDLVKAYELAGKSHPINVKVGDEDFLTLIKDADFDPKKHQLRHIVFGAIKKDQKVKAEVAIVIVLPEDEEQTPAERTGLIINRVIDNLEIEAIPSKLVDKLEVDGLKLVEVGDKLHISDITVPEGVEITEEDKEKTIVVVDAPRVEEPEPVAEGEEGEEGEESGETAEGEEGSKDSESAGSDSEKESAGDQEKSGKE